MKKCLEGSKAIAETINACRPEVVAAYPITPQTHIVENLSQYYADGKADFKFVRAESEFAAASIVLGGSAAGARTYTATSSQGLLLMTEVVFTISGMRLPVVLTCANRAISAPINIWNDHQDIMTVRDAGWLILFAENNQEAVDFHPIAFKVAEQLKIPVMVAVDGFILTHTVEGVELPSQNQLKKYLPKYKPAAGEYLDVNNPVSLGAFATPEHYQEIRQDLHEDILSAEKVLKKELVEYKKITGRGKKDLVEYSGHKKPEVVFVAMGAVVGTVKQAVNELNAEGGKAGVLKVKCFRPFPAKEIQQKVGKYEQIVVLDKNVSLRKRGGILFTEINSALADSKAQVKGVISGLGGRDITVGKIKEIYKKAKTMKKSPSFIA